MTAQPKLIVVAGHGAGDPGACREGYQEADLVRKLAARIKERGGDKVLLYDTGKNCYTETLNGCGIYEFAALGTPIVELHMDAAVSASARGAHLIIHSSKQGSASQIMLRDNLVRLFPGRSNTMVGKADFCNCNRAAALGLEYALCENGFISNSQDRAKFLENLDEIADMYLSAYAITPVRPQPLPEITVECQWKMQDLGEGVYAFESVAFPGTFLSMVKAN